jgi:hypothetical protein
LSWVGYDSDISLQILTCKLVLADSTREELRRRRRKIERFHRALLDDAKEAKVKVVTNGHKEAEVVAEGHKEANVVAEGYTNTYVVAEGYWEAQGC